MTPASAAYKRVFVTSTIYDGNLGGLSGADQKCLARANAPEVRLCGSADCPSGSWKAWLSDNTGSPSTRFSNVGGSLPYKLLNGITIANDWNDLTKGTINSPINLTELSTLPSIDIVWSNTTVSGTSINNPVYGNCSNFTTNSGANTPATTTFDGGSTYTDSKWTHWATVTCNPSYRLYCFEQ